ncbi:MAG: hypothetical protein ACOCXT_03580 [Candidatus Dojkabacteria bacterium]
MIWADKLKSVPNISNPRKLPPNGAIFLFKNLKVFKKIFIILTVIGIISSVLGFSTTYIVSRIINNIEAITTHSILSFYLPLLLTIYLGKEGLDYFRRRFSETLPTIFLDYTLLRFQHTLYAINSHTIFNYSKEKLLYIIGKYLEGVNNFLQDWSWRLPTEVTNLVIVCIILAVQNPVILLINSTYMGIYFAIAFRLSRKFSNLYSSYVDSNIEAVTTNQNFFLNFNTLKRLFGVDFAEQITREKYLEAWGRLHRVRSFHANRWFFQLNLFNLIFVGTFVYGTYQVAQGQLNCFFVRSVPKATNSTWIIAEC